MVRLHRLWMARFLKLGAVLLPGLALLVVFSAAQVWAQSQASTGLRVAVYTDLGTESDKVFSLYRALSSMGHHPLAITRADVLMGRLTRSNFDVFVLPSGEGGERCCSGHYADNTLALGSTAARNAVRAYLNSGGGLVGVEAGAYFLSLNGGTIDAYQANYRWTRPSASKRTLTITDAGFGSGSQQAWMSTGGGYFEVARNATVVARDTSNRPVIVRAAYGTGRVILTSFDLSLRGDSELDWTIWDNWAMGGSHINSKGAWTLLGRMIQYAYDGTSSAPAITETPNPAGARVAVMTSHTPDGGIAPPLLPSVGRAIEASGNVPLSIRFQEVIDGRLTLSNFKVAFFDGGYAYGLKLGLAGHEQKIRDFISSGGAYWGDCAGAFYAADVVNWDGRAYPFPFGIFHGTITGPINDITPWPNYTLTPIQVQGDPFFGDRGPISQLYYGGGFLSMPTDAEQGAHVYTVGTFGYGGSAAGKPAIVRYDYGSGRVVLLSTHLQARPGSEEDWTYWDNFYPSSNVPLNNSDNTWDLFGDLLNWVAQNSGT